MLQKYESFMQITIYSRKQNRGVLKCKTLEEPALGRGLARGLIKQQTQAEGTGALGRCHPTQTALRDRRY